MKKMFGKPKDDYGNEVARKPTSEESKGWTWLTTEKDLKAEMEPGEEDKRGEALTSLF